MIKNLVKKDIYGLIIGEIIYSVVFASIIMGFYSIDKYKGVYYPISFLFCTNLFFAFYICKDFSRKGRMKLHLLENTPITRKDYVVSRFILALIHSLLLFLVSNSIIGLLGGGLISCVSRQFDCNASFVILYIMGMFFWQFVSISFVIFLIFAFGATVTFWGVLLVPIPKLYQYYDTMLNYNSLFTTVFMAMLCTAFTYFMFKISIDTFENNDL